MSQLTNSIPSKPAGSTDPGIPRSLTYLILSICFLSILADGYDLGIYGAVIPSLLNYQPWGLSPAQAGAIGSYALFGMLIGAVAIGSVTDMIGRKWTLIMCITLFSLTMALCAMATSPEISDSSASSEGSD
jgi:MFS transporter, AAHS family, benzoate transport protein